MTFIVILASFASIAFIVKKSCRESYLYVYIPLLLCVPTWPRWVIAGLPDPTFQQAAILPIAAAFILRGNLPKISSLDFYIFVFLAVTGLSEYMNKGYADAQNLMFDVIASGLLPYLLTKALVNDWATRIRFMKVLVFCVSAVIVTGLFEFKFAYSPYRLVFDRIFPGQGSGWVTTFRYGLPRIAGPYGHAILAGVMFMIALRFQCWLRTSGKWTSKRWHITLGPFRDLNVTRFVTFWNFLGLCLSLVRGAQIGAILAWIMVRIGQSKKPVRRLRQAILAFSVLAVPGYLWFYSWIAGGRAAAVTAAQESAAYREELLQNYALVVVHHPWFGWGQNGWPKVGGMPSIDNYYLLVALNYGIPAVLFLFTILFSVSLRLGRACIREVSIKNDRTSLSLTLLSIYLGLGFSLATVYLGEGLFPLFFCLLGLTEAFLCEAEAKAPAAVRSRVAYAAPPVIRFRRVLN